MPRRDIFLITLAWVFTCGWLSRAEELPPGAAELTAMVTEAARTGQHKVRIPPGTYRLTAPPGARNCLDFAQLKDLEIDATGVELVCVDRVSGVLGFDHCENVVLRGAVLRHDPVPFSQGRIEAMAPDGGSVDVRIARGYPADLDDPCYFPHGGVAFLNVFEPDTRLWRREVPDIYYTAAERLGPDLFRFRAQHPLPAALRTGDLAAWRGNGRADVTLDRCARMKLLDVRIVSGVGFCVHEIAGEGGNFYRYTVTRGPAPGGAGETPLFACNADAFHSSGVRRGPTLEDCVFEYADDDGVPIHGSYGIVAAVDGAGAGKMFTLAHREEGSYRAGDWLRFYDAHGAFKARAQVREYAPDAATGLPPGAGRVGPGFPIPAAPRSGPGEAGIARAGASRLAGGQ